MSSCQVRPSKILWTMEEDACLLELVEQHGDNGSWKTISSCMEMRSGKQCRERYLNQLDPLIKKSMWTLEEDAAIKSMHYQFGKKWSKFMKKLPGRSDNAIKNRYHIISRDSYAEHNKNAAQNELGITLKVEAMDMFKDPFNISVSDAIRLDRFRVARDVLNRKIDQMLLEQDAGAIQQSLLELGEQNMENLASAVSKACIDMDSIHMAHRPPAPLSVENSAAPISHHTPSSHSTSFTCTSHPSKKVYSGDFRFDYDELFHEYDYGQYLGGAPAAKVLELAPTAQKAVLAELAALTAAAAAASSSSGASVTSMESNSVA